MRMHTVLVGVGCLVLGLLVTALTPRVTAQAQPDPCQAPWDVIAQVEEMGGGAGTQGGWSAVKWNRCTGEAFVFAVGPFSKEASAGVWSKNPVK